MLQLEPGLQVLQLERLRHFGPLQLHPLQAEVGAGLAQRTALPIEPQARRSLPLLHLQAQPVGRVDVAPHLRPIDPRQVGIEGAAPIAPLARAQLPERAGEIAAHAQALAPVRGRGGVEPELVLAPGVAQHQVDARELGHGQRGAGLVVPAQRALQQGQLGLPQQPVGQRAFVAGVFEVAQIDAAQQPAPIGAAAQLQHRAFDHDLIKAQPPQRGQRQRGAHAGQAQRFGAGGVAQHHVAQLQAGHRAAGVGRQGPDLDLHPQRLAGHALQRRTPLVNSWHNELMQRHPTEPQQQPRRHQQPQQRTQQPGLPVQPARWMGGAGFIEHTKL